MNQSALLSHVVERLIAAETRRNPFSHWLLSDVLPRELARELTALPVTPPPAGDTLGKRETHNSDRTFLSAALQEKHAAAGALAAVFQEPEIVGLLEGRTGTRLAGNYLRIEYCQDRAGFWLEPHTDIGAKAFTMLIYLSDTPEAADWGTDIYDGALNHVGRAPGDFNRGLIFVPGTDTWHGVEPRPIDGIRKSIIINYVKPEWRSRHELAFPESPVLAWD